MPLFMVETVSIFRMKYLVEANEESHALDEVTMQGEELKEFSQKYVDENILSSRAITKKDALKEFDKDNEYLKDWSSSEKIAKTVNTIDYTK